jgi:methionine-rich copper-binding protein CopC
MRIFAALAAAVALAATLIFVSAASAHAPIVSITWDSDTNPTTLTASTDERPLETSPNSFYLRVYNAAGSRVDNGDATVSADGFSITVTLVPDLQAGPYRVEWKTTSTDGAILFDSVPVPLPGGVVPSDEEEGHEHEEGEEHEEGDEHEGAEEQAPDTTAPVSPPNAGDAGLLDERPRGFNTLSALAGAGIAVTTAGGAIYAYRRRS